MSNPSTDLLSLPVREFLDRAGSRTPTPGGGSISALVGALATTMAQMTARYTLGNKKYAEHEAVVQAWLVELERACDAFCELLAEDVAAYERYSEASKDKSGSEAAAREKASALATATAVPMEIVALAAAVAEGMDRVKEKCNRHLLSDLVVGAVLCDAAAHGAAANVRVNLSLFPDPQESDRLAEELRAMLAHVRRHRDSVAALAAV